MGRIAADRPPVDEFAGMSVTAVLTEALDDATARFLAIQDPKQRRDHLRKRINLAVGLPADRDWWVSGKTADLIIQDRIELSWLEKQLAALTRRRYLPADDANHIGKPEPWLQRAVAKLCDRRGLLFHKARRNEGY
jgi:hypothetical protein